MIPPLYPGTSGLHEGRTAQTLDSETLAQVRNEGEELLRDLIELFLREAPERLELLAAAIAKGDGRIAERAAHTLKNSAAILGAVSMQTVAATAEIAARDGKLSEVAALLDDLRLKSEAVIAALIEERSRLDKPRAAE